MRRGQTGIYFLKVEIKDYNTKIIGRNFLNWAVNNDIKTSKNNRKIAAGQENHYAIRCLLD